MTQILLIIPLILVLATFFIPLSLKKNPFFSYFSILLSSGTLFMSISILRFFSNNEDSSIGFKLFKVIRKVTPEEKLATYRETFNFTLDSYIRINPELADYKQKILSLNQWPSLDSFEQLSLLQIKELAETLPKTLYQRVIEQEALIRKEFLENSSSGILGFITNHPILVFGTLAIIGIGVGVWYFGLPTFLTGGAIAKKSAEGFEETANVSDVTKDIIVVQSIQMGELLKQVTKTASKISDNVERLQNLNSGKGFQLSSSCLTKVELSVDQLSKKVIGLEDSLTNLTLAFAEHATQTQNALNTLCKVIIPQLIEPESLSNQHVVESIANLITKRCNDSETVIKFLLGSDYATPAIPKVSEDSFQPFIGKGFNLK